MRMMRYSVLSLALTFTLLVPAAWGAFATPQLAGDDSEPAAAHDACDDTAPADVESYTADEVAESLHIDATLRGLYARYQGLPGFIDVYYSPDADVVYRPMFVEEVPVEALAQATPVEVAFDVIPAYPVPASSGPAPDASDLRCSLIRPGAEMASPSGCTYNWVFTAGGNTYIGTAGHCINAGQTAHLTGIGIIGNAVFSTGDGGVGNDFALIKVNADKVQWVNPEMCQWAGPTGTFTGATSFTGKVTVQTGHGLVPSVSALVPPRPKTGVGVSYGVDSFTWSGTSWPGDSGSPIRLQGGLAVGVVTHLLLAAPVLNFGTSLPHAMALTGVNGLTLSTVPYVHPI